MFQATVQTAYLGKITIAIAPKPSRADAFKALGARVWIRGIPHCRRENVGQWLREMASIADPSVSMFA